MRSWDIAVIGAGVFGSWTAWHLRRAGQSVLLVDAWGPGHSRSSSGGESRIIRMGYGPDEIYSRMALSSLGQWQDLSARTGQQLFLPTGVLWIARQDDPYSAATRSTLERVGVPAEILPAAELARRYPQMLLDDPCAYGILEPQSGALLARRAVAAVVQEATRDGVKFSIREVTAVPPHGIRAGVYVFACGPWLPKLFPALLANRIRPTRQEVYFFAPPPGERRFTAPEFPVWIDFSDPRRPYGFPDVESRGVKLAFDRHGPVVDPDTLDRRVTDEGVAEARRFLAERFPALAGAPLTESRVCQYENTSNADFLIDRHPDFDNIWLVGGGSGHGFKHGPAVGAYVSARILEGAEGEPRFSL